MASRLPLRLRHERRTDERGRARSAPPLRAVEFDPFEDEAALEMARRSYELRRRRDVLFGRELFQDPAWDLLLYLFRAAGANQEVGVSEACDGMAVPQTTALRWIRQLEEAGLIVREGDPADARRSHVRLSRRAARLMYHLLREGGQGMGEGP